VIFVPGGTAKDGCHAKAQRSHYLASRQAAKVAKVEKIIKADSSEGCYGLYTHIFLCVLCAFA
jgi:hypothetical protein